MLKLVKHARQYSSRGWSLHNAKVLGPDLGNPTWVEMQRIKYIRPDGQEATWDYCSRRKRKENISSKPQNPDAVGILAVTNNRHLVLVRQFRPAVDGICIEMPAGLVDAGETPEEAAIRELAEETGYHGEITGSSSTFYNDPGFCNTSLALVKVSVDLQSTKNQHPKPHPDRGEFIEVFELPLDRLAEDLERMQQEDSAFLDARLYTFAKGMQFARTLNNQIL